MIPQRIDPSREVGADRDAPREHEIKLVLARQRVPIVRRWLELRCPRHPRFPASIVSSIYFDNRRWRSLAEKANGEFLKTKIRLRWYSDVDTGEPGDSVHLEVKYKRGARRAKLRVPVDVHGAALSGLELDGTRLPDVERLLREHGVTLEEPVLPVFRIDYTRRRFLEPVTRSNLCLDYDIHVPRSSRRMIRRHDPRHLGCAVFESKGRSTRLPPLLQPLIELGCRRGAFSKYLDCYERLTDTTA